MGARAVVLDFTFDEQSSDPGQDALLREAVQRLTIPLAVGFSVNVPSQQGQPLPGARRHELDGGPPAGPSSRHAAPRPIPSLHPAGTTLRRPRS